MDSSWVTSWIILGSLLCHPTHGTDPHNLGAKDHFSIKWRKIAEERTLHPANLTAWEILKEREDKLHDISVLAERETIEIYRNGELVYEKQGQMTEYGFLTHWGIHVVVLHPEHGKVMLARQFLTFQPAEHRNLATCIRDLLPGRILVVVAVPNAATYLGEDAIWELEVMGSTFLSGLAVYEAWAMVAETPVRTYLPLSYYYPHLKFLRNTSQEHRQGRVWGESAAILRAKESTRASPLHLHVFVPRMKGLRCEWHEDSKMRLQKDFCETYEGYHRLCRCQDPVTPALRYSALHIKMKEVIPVAMLTAIKPFNFYRQLLNLLETPGAAQTPVVVMIDGHQTEITRLARLFGLDVLVHRPQGEPGSPTLLNMHFRFSVHNVFNFFPDVDKAIILEDDLLLSPDFFQYFQQTAWLLDADPTIYCVNAFSVNSYPEVAYDPTVLRRLEMFPQFGWMIKRTWAQEQYHRWVPEKYTGDWDWYLTQAKSRQNRHALVPEISRTFHAGSAGAHVTGWAQENLFSHMIYNQDPRVRLRGLKDLIKHRYDAKLKREILRATTLNLTKSPCDKPILPANTTGPFKIFVETPSDNDEYNAFYVMQLCLHGYSEDSREKYNGVMRYNLGGHILYIIGCPRAPYCAIFPGGIDTLKPSQQLVLMAEKSASKWQTRNYPPKYQQRTNLLSPEQEFLMQNLVYVYWNRTVIQPMFIIVS